MFFMIKGIAQTNETFVSGIAVDTKNIPVESATISLMKLKDSSIIKIAITDNTGKFSFSGIPYGTYYISISSINFNTIQSSIFLISENNKSVVLTTLILQAVVNNLTAVTVNSKKPLIEQKIDRMIVNVDASVTNTGSTALEVL